MACLTPKRGSQMRGAVGGDAETLVDPSANVRGHAVPPKMFCKFPDTFGRELLARSHKAKNACSDGLRVGGGQEDTVPAVLDGVRRATLLAADYWHTRGRSLRIHNPKPFDIVGTC